MLALLTGAASTGVASAATATAAGAPAKDTFSGHLVKATGKLASDRGTVTVLIHVTQSTSAARQMKLTFIGAACSSSRHCLRLSGTLAGTISARPATIPDVGRRYDLSAGGRLTPLGRLSATGVVTGVGFIRAGHEGMTLTLRTRQGSVTIAATSPKVPGFTSP